MSAHQNRGLTIVNRSGRITFRLKRRGGRRRLCPVCRGAGVRS